MSRLIAKPTEVGIRNVSLVEKLDVIGAAIGAVREAHRDVISPKSWAALNVAQEKIGEAILHLNDERRYLQSVQKIPPHNFDPRPSTPAPFNNL